MSLSELGSRVGMSGSKLCRLEAGKSMRLTVEDACRVAAVFGLDLSMRLFPNGVRIRDRAQAERLATLLSSVRPPLTYRTDAPLPQGFANRVNCARGTACSTAAG